MELSDVYDKDIEYLENEIEKLMETSKDPNKAFKLHKEV